MRKPYEPPTTKKIDNPTTFDKILIHIIKKGKPKSVKKKVAVNRKKKK